MTDFKHKIDFMATIVVENANPNGDPLNGNYPRTDLDGYGIISDVAIKRKIRNRMQDEGEEIFVKSNERINDGFRSLEKRYQNVFTKKGKELDEEVYQGACQRWLDVRSFGQVITFDKKSIGIRGPVSISMAKSLSPVNATSMQITRSTNGQESDKKASDTMGTKNFVDFGVYLVKGSINVFFAEKTGFTEADAAIIKESLRTLFVNDASSARPEGSMDVKDIYWFEHPTKMGVLSSSKVFDMLTYEELDLLESKRYEDYNVHLDEEKRAYAESLGLVIEHSHGL